MEPCIILGLDGASAGLRAMLSPKQPLPGVWGEKIGDDILLEGAKNLLPLGFKKKFIDLKHSDTKDRLVRIIAGYSKLPYPPALVTISGELDNLQSFREIVAAGKNIGIILTGPLSDWSEKYCIGKLSMSRRRWMKKIITHAVKSGAEGVTCPAWLLNDRYIAKELQRLRKKDRFTVVATGIRSEGIPPGNHVDPRTPAFAIKHGASLIVVESEVTGAPCRQPLLRLQQIAEAVASVVPA